MTAPFDLLALTSSPFAPAGSTCAASTPSRPRARAQRIRERKAVHLWAVE
jgi:hypothetical protein